jgi:hypothetical protein
MPINFIPNDPLTQEFAPQTTIDPSAERIEDFAGFNYEGVIGEGTYDFGTPEFLHWQCREGALRAVELFESLSEPIDRWQGNQAKLNLSPNAREELNAYYDRQALVFCESIAENGKQTFTGASVDIVSHETGHAILDKMRPEFWNSFIEEIGAFHESFGDCIAILTALNNKSIRETLLNQTNDLSDQNFVESFGQDLADGVFQKFGIEHPSSKPRRARNDFKWDYPKYFPYFAPPDELSREIHSFSRVLTGCIWDSLRLVFAQSNGRSEQELLESARTVGKLLVAAANTAAPTPRFFHEVGRAMISADRRLFAGNHEERIREAFANHNIMVGSVGDLEATETLKAEPAKKDAFGNIELGDELLRELASKIGYRSEKPSMTFRSVSIAGRDLIEATSSESVPLDRVHEKLKGVAALVTRSAVLGEVAGQAVMFRGGAEAFDLVGEVESFVQNLAENGRIQFKGEPETSATSNQLCSHRVVEQNGHNVLERVRFTCAFSGCQHTTVE